MPDSNVYASAGELEARHRAVGPLATVRVTDEPGIPERRRHVVTVHTERHRLSLAGSERAQKPCLELRGVRLAFAARREQMLHEVARGPVEAGEEGPCARRDLVLGQRFGMGRGITRRELDERVHESLPA